MPNPKTELKKYSVLLLYPDYIASTYGQDTFFTRVKAFSHVEAVIIARREATRGDEKVDQADFYPLLVIKGHHQDLLTP